MIDESARGVYAIAPTPFFPDGRIDYGSTDRMVDRFLHAGVDGITVLGMMGEAQKLTIDESVTFTRHVTARIAGRIPVLAGVSAPSFAQMQAVSDMAMDSGAAGVMIAPPGSVRTDDQIVGYFHEAVNFIGSAPFVLQDFPQAAGVQISVSVIRRVIAELGSCVCLKHEDWPGLDKITALRADGCLDRRISILCGNGGLFLPEEMERGADGAMTGFAYPEMMVEVIRLCNEGSIDAALELFFAYLPLIRFEQQPGLGLAVRKYVLARRGIIGHADLRRPGASLTVETQRNVDRLLAMQEARLRELGH